MKEGFAILLKLQVSSADLTAREEIPGKGLQGKSPEGDSVASSCAY